MIERSAMNTSSKLTQGQEQAILFANVVDPPGSISNLCGMFGRTLPAHFPAQRLQQLGAQQFLPVLHMSMK